MREGRGDRYQVERWIVSHGFALNLTTELEYFQGIVPCGIADKRATSVERLNGRRLATESAARGYAVSFARALGVELDWAPRLPELVGARKTGDIGRIW